MAERLMGVESELAFAAVDRAGQVIDIGRGVGRLLELARDRLKHLPGLGPLDMFLTNGSRLYADSGMHPESCTPEVANPWDAVRYVQANENLLAGLLREMAREPQFAEASLYKCNVDYSGTNSTWGCHESYLHRADPRLLSGEIIPHLVSRVIYTGAGGFRTGSAGLEFTLSPRAAHMTREVSDSSTYDRGIFHTKDESLSPEGYHRLHVLCGESLCSHAAMWLKMGATAVVVAMIEGGLRPGTGVRPRAALSALHTFASDPTCTRTVQVASGKSLTALQIQRHILELAEAHVADPFMPPWTAAVCRLWRAMLDRLEGGPQAVATTLDWAIKLSLYRDWAQREGVAWESLNDWAHVLNSLVAALAQTPFKDKSVTVEFALGPDSPIPDEVKRLGPYLAERGMNWNGLRPFVQLRPALFEADTRFGQIGESGIFASLDRQGVLDHAVPDVDNDNIEHAMANPPAVGRAKIRGRVVRERSGGDGRYVCTWMKIVDLEHKRVLDLSDPFASEETWREADDQTVGVDLASLDLRMMEVLMSRRRRAAAGSERVVF